MKELVSNSFYQETIFNVFPYDLPAFPLVHLTNSTFRQMHYHSVLKSGTAITVRVNAPIPKESFLLRKATRSSSSHTSRTFQEVSAVIKAFGTFHILIYRRFFPTRYSTKISGKSLLRLKTVFTA